MKIFDILPVGEENAISAKVGQEYTTVSYQKGNDNG